MFDTLLYPSSEGQLEIKTLQKHGETMFHLADVVRVITKETQSIDGNIVTDQSSFLRESISSLDDDERHVETIGEDGRNAVYEYYVSEPGIYRVVSRAKSSGAKKFQRWIYHDVMPSLRKYGQYPAPQINDDSFLLQLADQHAKQSQLLSQYIRQSETKFKELEDRLKDTDKQFDSINERLVLIEESSLPSESYYSVSDCLKSLDLDTKDLIYVIALCEKICTEKELPYLPSFRKIREEQRFTKDVIELALNYARLK